MTIVKAMTKVLVVYETTNKVSAKEQISNVNEFVHDLGIDHMNMFKIQAYLEKSKLSRKLNGFLDMKKRKAQPPTEATDKIDDGKQLVSSIPVLNQIEAFLMALTNADKDGRIIRGINTYGAYVQYMLLNPANEFKEIVEDARSVVLAGGTMEPVSRMMSAITTSHLLTAVLQIGDFLTHLFPNVNKDRISKFSCGHIIPKENLQVLTVASGPSGMKLTYNYESRSDSKLVSTGSIFNVM